MVEAGKGIKRRARVTAGGGASREVKVKLAAVVVAQESKAVSGWWQLRVVLCNTTARKKCVPKDRVAIRGGPSFGGRSGGWKVDSRTAENDFQKGSNRGQKAGWPLATW